MTKDYFTVDEVNDLIPKLEFHFRKMLLHKREMAKTSNQLRKLGAVPQLIGRVPTEARAEVQGLQSRLRASYREFKQHLFAVEELGGDIKDLELGRVDFSTQKDGEDHVLVWQLGMTDRAILMPVTERIKASHRVYIEFPQPYPI